MIGTRALAVIWSSASMFVALSFQSIVVKEDVWAFQIHCPTNIIELFQTSDIVIEGKKISDYCPQEVQAVIWSSSVMLAVIPASIVAGVFFLRKALRVKSGRRSINNNN